MSRALAIVSSLLEADEFEPEEIISSAQSADKHRLFSDMEAFFAHFNVDAAVSAYLKTVVGAACDYFDKRGFSGPKFAYWHTRHLNYGQPFVVIDWEAHYLRRGSYYRPSDVINVEMVKEAAKILHSIPRPPMIVDDITVKPRSDWTGGPQLEIFFREDIAPDTWEEGSPGFDI